MRFAACAAVVVLATAAVGFQTAPPAPSANDACSFLTKDDATAALGEAVTGPRATRTPSGASACEYSGSGIHGVSLSVMPLTASTAAVYTGLCAKKSKDGLTGLGDVTCWYDDKHGELQVLKGLLFLSIKLRKNSDPTEAIKAVAKKVYDRVK